jgi:hypothetical protein
LLVFIFFKFCTLVAEPGGDTVNNNPKQSQKQIKKDFFSLKVIVPIGTCFHSFFKSQYKKRTVYVRSTRDFYQHIQLSSQQRKCKKEKKKLAKDATGQNTKPSTALSTN